jgi:putative hydrolase of the HAD superfamily
VDLGRRSAGTVLRAVLFDAVGTLIAPDPPVIEAYHTAGLGFGSSLPAETIGLRFRSAFARQETLDAEASHRTSEARELARWRTIVAEVFDDVPDTEALFQTLWRHFAEPGHWRVYDDAAECWQRLAESGFFIGIASNFDARLEAICQGHELLAGRPCFISSHMGYKKPAPEFFRFIEQRLELRPDEILLVGDDLENDYLAAQAAGWQALLLSRPPSG